MKKSGFNKKPGFKRKRGLTKSGGLNRQNYRKKIQKKEKRKVSNTPPRQIEIRKLDRAFSLLVRANWADVNGNCKCFTCDRVAPWKKSVIQCGHFISRSNMAVRWRTYNAHPQCSYCNQTLNGSLSIYRTRLIETYGEDILRLLEEESRVVTKLTLESLKKLRLGVEKKLKNIRTKKGL